MHAYEVIINSTCTTSVEITAESKEQARSLVAVEIARQGNDPEPSKLRHYYAENYFVCEPSEKWTVKEVEKYARTGE